MIDVKNRVPTQANRKKITFEDDGTSRYAVVEYADNPAEQGTPINKVLFDSINTDIININSELLKKTSIDLLWTNASPDSSFVGQVINLDFSQYNIFVIVGKINATTNEYQVLFAIKNILSLGSVLSSGEFAYYTRKFTFTDNQVTISNNTTRTPSFTGENNTQNIPIKIYGIKGVQ